MNPAIDPPSRWIIPFRFDIWNTAQIVDDLTAMDAYRRRDGFKYFAAHQDDNGIVHLAPMDTYETGMSLADLDGSVLTHTRDTVNGYGENLSIFMARPDVVFHNTLRELYAAIGILFVDAATLAAQEAAAQAAQLAAWQEQQDRSEWQQWNAARDAEYVRNYVANDSVQGQYNAARALLSWLDARPENMALSQRYGTGIPFRPAQIAHVNFLAGELNKLLAARLVLIPSPVQDAAHTVQFGELWVSPDSREGAYVLDHGPKVAVMYKTFLANVNRTDGGLFGNALFRDAQPVIPYDVNDFDGSVARFEEWRAANLEEWNARVNANTEARAAFDARVADFVLRGKWWSDVYPIHETSVYAVRLAERYGLTILKTLDAARAAYARALLGQSVDRIGAQSILHFWFPLALHYGALPGETTNAPPHVYYAASAGEYFVGYSREYWDKVTPASFHMSDWLEIISMIAAFFGIAYLGSITSAQNFLAKNALQSVGIKPNGLMMKALNFGIDSLSDFDISSLAESAFDADAALFDSALLPPIDVDAGIVIPEIVTLAPVDVLPIDTIPAIDTIAEPVINTPPMEWVDEYTNYDAGGFDLPDVSEIDFDSGGFAVDSEGYVIDLDTGDTIAYDYGGNFLDYPMPDDPIEFVDDDGYTYVDYGDGSAYTLDPNGDLYMDSNGEIYYTADGVAPEPIVTNDNGEMISFVDDDGNEFVSYPGGSYSVMTDGEIYSGVANDAGDVVITNSDGTFSFAKGSTFMQAAQVAQQVGRAATPERTLPNGQKVPAQPAKTYPDTITGLIASVIDTYAQYKTQQNTAALNPYRQTAARGGYTTLPNGQVVRTNAAGVPIRTGTGFTLNQNTLLIGAAALAAIFLLNRSRR